MSIAIWGDSITHGFSDVKQGGWANRLKVYLESQDDDVAVFNLGISGDTSDDLLERFVPECAARKPDIIVISIGINDSLYEGSKDNPQVSLDKYENNLRTLIDKARKYTDKIIFIGLTSVDESRTMPIPWHKEGYYDNDNIRKYNFVVQKLSSENELQFIDLNDVLTPDDLHDGVHPTPEGHRKIFEKVREHIKI